MSTIDTLINNATARATAYVGFANDIMNAIDATMPEGLTTPTQTLSGFFETTLTAPNADAHDFPVYEDPPGDMPGAPEIVSIPAMTTPQLPTAPTVSTSGLFQTAMPSTTVPEWTESAPALRIDELYTELEELARPVLQSVILPEISPLTLPCCPPELQLPVYDDIPTPEAIPAPVNYADTMRANYVNALPEMRQFVDDIVAGWVQQFAPGFYEARDSLQAKLLAGLNEAQALPDRFEAALYSRAQARVESAYREAEQQLLETSAKRGFLVPPGAVIASIGRLRSDGAKALAGQSTDIYIERRKTELQHLQFIMQTIGSQLQSVQSLAMGVAQTIAGVLQQATVYAGAITDKLGTLFEHNRSRHEFSLAVLKGLNEQYEVKLKAALSTLDGFELELKTAMGVKDVEFKRVEGAKLQLEAQQLEVTRYSAMVDAIARRAAIDEMAIKQFEAKKDVFDIETKIMLATFEVYKAANDGDRSKLEGELGKIRLYEEQLKSKELIADVEIKQIEGVAKTNEALLGQYSSLLNGYKIGADVTLQKFTAHEAIKKLGLDSYKTNVDANLEIYKARVQKDTEAVSALVNNFRANLDSITSLQKLQQDYIGLNLKKGEIIANNCAGMASSTLQSLNTMVSVAGSE